MTKANSRNRTKSKPIRSRSTQIVGEKIAKKVSVNKIIATTSNKNAQVLAATVGGAVIGNLIAPGIGGALFGGVIGALLGNASRSKGAK